MIIVELIRLLRRGAIYANVAYSTPGAKEYHNIGDSHRAIMEDARTFQRLAWLLENGSRLRERSVTPEPPVKPPKVAAPPPPLSLKGEISE